MGAGLGKSNILVGASTEYVLGSNDEERYLDKIDELVSKITAISIELSEEYNKEFLRPDFCNRVALVASQSLGNLSSVNLNGINHTLGIVAGDPEFKENMCNLIVKHYIDRINLISVIVSSLEYCSDRVKALVVGPICEGHADIFNKDECDTVCGAGKDCWREQSLIPKNAPRDQTYFKILKELNDEFINSLETLKNVLVQLTDLKNNIKDEELKKLIIEVQKEISAMKTKCNELYYAALLNPPYTQEELSQLNQSAGLRERLYDASVDARRKVENDAALLNKGMEQIADKNAIGGTGIGVNTR